MLKTSLLEVCLPICGTWNRSNEDERLDGNDFAKALDLKSRLRLIANDLL